MTKNDNKSVVLMILDGWGIAPPSPDNAVAMAKTPILDALQADRPWTLITAHGRAVGLPKGQMGNSEVGHLNLGAGRVVKQDLVIIDEAVEDGSFAKNPVFGSAADKINAAKGRAHLMGLCSPGGVHSSLEHLYALVDLLHARGLEVFIHAITDGRDTPPRSAAEYIEGIEGRIRGKARISTVVGRYYSMDRDKRWDRVKRGYMAHTAGEGTRHESAPAAVRAAYADGENDEFITPRIVEPAGVIRDGDGVFFFNFRADRAREMTEALTFDDFAGFERPVRPALAAYVCMTEYQADYGLPVAFAPSTMDNILGEVLSNRGVAQLRCAETEKYAHVTFFFNGGKEEPYAGEDRTLIPSPKEVATYDLAPKMSAEPVANAVIEAIHSKKYRFILVNFANGDMVGHTGFFDAAVAAAETVDAQVGRITEAARAEKTAVVITADHGNLEQMLDPNTKQPHTAHTTNPVPVILVAEDLEDARLTEGGSLQDVAPTVLDLLGIEKPAEMTGTSLIARQAR